MIASLTQIVPAPARMVHTLLPEGLPVLHHAAMAITFWMGEVYERESTSNSGNAGRGEDYGR
jgi:hypothetical protein